MLAYLDGILEHKGVNYVIIDVNGMGFKVYVPLRILPDMPDVQKRIRLYVHWHISEGFVALFGFCSSQEVDMFESLISVSGVGPRGAMALLDAFSCDQLLAAIAQQDAKVLSRAKGIGMKTAQRIIMELKDKLHLSDEAKARVDVKKDNSSLYSRSMEALMALGYTPAEAAEALKGLSLNDRSLEDIVKDALKRL